MDRSKIKSHIDRISSLMENHSDSEVKCAITKTIMSYLSKCDDNTISELLDCVEGLCKYNNYLTEKESRTILSEFRNWDGSTGTPFSPQILDELQKDNKCIDNVPEYNKWALYITMCKFASDQGGVISKLVNNDSKAFINACYDMSIAQLKDVDRPRWVRHYFNLF